MIARPDRDEPLPPATNGEIAARNLESARRGAWVRFVRDAGLPGLAETIADEERLANQFLGDLTALDRLDDLATAFSRVDHSFRAELLHAQAASAAHRFDEARRHLLSAAALGALPEVIARQSMTLDQACGVNLEAALAARRHCATASGRLEEQVPFGALLADLERFAEADTVYRSALYAYDGASPFPAAWVCFQLGTLWGETVPKADPDLAALWYRRALDYLPAYVKARVHLAEICASQGQIGGAEALLRPALASGDPEVRWRLADVLVAQGRLEEAETHLGFARAGFEALLRKHLLAFADHAAEFYAGSGDDHEHAHELARINVANRATRRALKLSDAIAANRPVRGENP